MTDTATVLSSESRSGRMRVGWLVALLVSMTLAGCAQTDDPVVADDPAATPPVVVPENVTVSGGAASLDDLVFGQVRYTPTGFRGAEPNMGVTSSGAVFAMAGSTVIRSLDRGENWSAVQTHQLMNSDPMLWVDPWTDCIYNAPMFPILLGATLYVSCDDGDTWTPLHSQNMGRGVYDHQKLASALPGPDAPPGVGVLHPTSLIMCYNALYYTNCAVSFDGGITWPHDGPIWQGVLTVGDTMVTGGCAGQQSHPTGAPDGTIVVAKAWGCSEPWVFVSTDNGITWEQRPGPQGVGSDTLDPEIAFSDDGTMYMLWQSKRGESRAHLARSEDYGATWSGMWDVTPPGMNSTIFASLHAGSPGRVAMAFHATNVSGDPGSVPDDTLWYTYVVTSEDATADDPTFVSYKATDDPIQVGSICKGNRGCSNGNRNLLDFIDGAVGPDGTFYTIIADGCTGKCAEGDHSPANSRDRAVGIIRLDGWSLHA